MINLDGMSPRELRDFHAKFVHATDKEALSIFDTEQLQGNDRSDLGAWARRLFARYANIKAQAMDLRTNGKISEALAKEELCERVYNRIPKEIRW